ncbi:Leucine Rich repeats (2 copies) [Rosistilla ulvae]|uniref:Leucine Rich repeats (2 copies) n=1 Tax=Rosistilla ulvae TaxID=1930277 RepID=A0A517LWV7_9BACT|nr:hypothetical protein [Rosistilla ulvae]QDS87116.1 Leucine Rich repeats (2 copies) [Rosistilla ulvae]
MTFVRTIPTLLLTLLLLSGCKKQEVAQPNNEPAEAPAPAAAAEPTPDDAEVVAAIEAAGGVTVKKKGENIVELDLRGLFPDAAEDQADEFAWVAGLPKLQKILARGPGVTLEAVEKLKAHPELKVIGFDNCTQVGDEAVAVLVTLPKLADVDLIKSEITDESLKTLAGCDTIRQIRIARTKVTDAGIKSLEAAKQLELLDLLECSLLTNECATSVGKLTKMRNVRLPNAVDDSGLAQLTGLNNLVALGLQYCRVGPEGIKHLVGLKELKEINLYGASKVDDEVIPLLAQLPKLQKVRARETSIRGENAAAFADMKALRDLDLSESPVQDAVFEHLAKLPNLENLNLWNTEATEEGIAQLKGMTQLKQLNLDNLGDAISDDCLDTIATMTNLELLHLGGTGVTDEGMPKLYGLKKLKRLFITRTYVIEKSTVEALKQELPQAKIEW